MFSRMFSRSTLAPEDFPGPDESYASGDAEQRLILAGGCFWCTEAVYRELEGVASVISGYAGGRAETANYEAVCTGRTGHAEAIEIRFDPKRVQWGELLRIFFSVAHDPTQLNRQGNDIGTQYRSAIFYSSPEEKQIAADYIAKLNKAKLFDATIATTLEPLEKFYPAEDYHQDYARLNPAQPYIRAISAPKVAKLRQHFPGKLKKG